MARQPAATRLEVGSTPTGVSDQPTAGLDYIFYRKGPVSEPILRWLVFESTRLTVGST